MKFLDKLLNKNILLKKLDGYKSYISLTVYVLSILFELLNEKETADILREIGAGGLALGVSGKLAKEKTSK